jgi:hypothetical protein
VPLALIYGTTTGGVSFVDKWSVRRSLTKPPLTESPLYAPDRRIREGEAMFLQFQEHLEWLRLRSNHEEFDRLRMVDHFRYVPAAGIVPLANPVETPTGTRPLGVNFLRFFDGTEYRNLIDGENIVIEAARIVNLLRMARDYPPLDLTQGVMLWIYSVRENMEAMDENPLNPPRQYVIFTTGYMPFLGDPHYTVNRYDYGNYF